MRKPSTGGVYGVPGPAGQASYDGVTSSARTLNPHPLAGRDGRCMGRTDETCTQHRLPFLPDRKENANAAEAGEQPVRSCRNISGEGGEPMHLVLTAVTTERSSPPVCRHSSLVGRTDGRTGVPSSDGVYLRVLSHSLVAHVYEDQLCRCWRGWQGVHYSADARLMISDFLPLSITWMDGVPAGWYSLRSPTTTIITTPEPQGPRQLRHPIEKDRVISE